MSVNAKMTALADEVRTLSGATDTLGLDEMASHTNEANAEVGTQTDLIQQLKIALQGKVAGSTPENLNAELTEQESLIERLRTVLVTKAAGSGGITLDDIATKAIEGDVVLSVATIGSYAFHGCSKITSLYAPKVTEVGAYAFYGVGLTGALDLPICTSIGSYAFFQCTNMTSLSIPNVTSVGANAFQYCNKLTALDAPNLTTLGGYAFSGNNTYKMAFKSINLPKCTGIPASTLTYCTNVTELVLPECKSVGNSALTNWTNLQYVDLPKCTSIANYGLRNNSKLATLILRSEAMCTLSNYALNSSKIFNGTGYVYVPKALLSDDDATKDYRRATNWKTIYTKNANAFRALEDYTVDGTLSGALDENKI